MSTSWSLPTSAIIQDAYELLGVIGAGETISAEDNNLALTAFQNILKEMPIHGFVWNKITPEPTALTWSALTPKKVSMPIDYFGAPVISFIQNSVNVDLTVINKAEYEALEQPDYVALYPQYIYIAPDNVGYLWPVPSSNPSLTITYQAIATDATLPLMPDIAQSYISGFGSWLAYELMPKFKGISADTKADIKERYVVKRKMMLEYSVETSPLTFEVVD